MKKNTFLSFALIILCTLNFPFAQAAEQGVCRQTESEVKSATYGHIDAKALKILIDTKVPFILLDGRGKTKWDDGRRIPGAKAANYEFSSEEFAKLIPNKEDLVIVYCGAYECPLGKKLAAKLVDVGYQYVLEYPGGMKEWHKVANYPIEK